MEKINISWNKEEFNAYVLIYAAQSNFVETNEEKEFIESRFNKTFLQNIYQEIQDDNDYEKIQKIMAYVKQHQYSKEDLNNILNDIKAIYLCDGNFDSIEQAIYYCIKKIFNSKN